MNWVFIPAHPKHIGERKILQAGNLVQGMPEEKRDFLPLADEETEEASRLLEGFFRVSSAGIVVSLRRLPRNQFIGDRIAASLVDRESCRAQELREADGVHNA